MAGFHNFSSSNGGVLDISRIRSVNQDRAADSVSEKYAFIPTTRALAVLQDSGWEPIKVQEKNTRKIENQGFQKHMLRLRNREYGLGMVGGVGSEFPEIVLTNSHDGLGAFNLMAGWFVMVCGNGLVVSKGETSKFRITHKGFTEDRVQDALNGVLEFFPKIVQAREDFGSVMLDRPEQELYAETAIKMVLDPDGVYHINPREVLYNHRPQQQAPTLWNTFNTVQEKVIGGGVNRRNVTTRRRARSQQVRDIDKNVQKNSALWELTERFHALKTGQPIAN